MEEAVTSGDALARNAAHLLLGAVKARDKFLTPWLSGVFLGKPLYQSCRVLRSKRVFNLNSHPDAPNVKEFRSQHSGKIIRNVTLSEYTAPKLSCCDWSARLTTV